MIRINELFHTQTPTQFKLFTFPAHDDTSAYSAKSKQVNMLSTFSNEGNQPNEIIQFQLDGKVEFDWKISSEENRCD